jgi:hypothetical protein
MSDTFWPGRDAAEIKLVAQNLLLEGASRRKLQARGAERLVAEPRPMPIPHGLHSFRPWSQIICGSCAHTPSTLQATGASGQNEPMPDISHFIASNGRPVTKLMTPSGVTAYVADEIPLEALIGLRDQLLKDQGLPAEHEPDRMTPSRSNGEPGLKPR